MAILAGDLYGACPGEDIGVFFVFRSLELVSRSLEIVNSWERDRHSYLELAISRERDAISFPRNSNSRERNTKKPLLPSFLFFNSPCYSHFYRS